MRVRIRAVCDFPPRGRKSLAHKKRLTSDWSVQTRRSSMPSCVTKKKPKKLLSTALRVRACVCVCVCVLCAMRVSPSFFFLLHSFFLLLVLVLVLVLFILPVAALAETK